VVGWDVGSFERVVERDVDSLAELGFETARELIAEQQPHPFFVHAVDADTDADRRGVRKPSPSGPSRR
jgi:hypothetical protein